MGEGLALPTQKDGHRATCPVRLGGCRELAEWARAEPQAGLAGLRDPEARVWGPRTTSLRF